MRKLWKDFLSICILLIWEFVEKAMSRSNGISESSLRTEVWYTVDMKCCMPGYLTWTTKSHSGIGIHWYLHHVFQLGNSSKYQTGGDWYEGTLWQFIPSEIYSGWYKMKNCLFEDSYVTWSTTDFVTRHAEKNISNYVILERGRSEEDYMIKPVVQTDEQTSKAEGRYHQLKMRQYPKGFITWSSDTTNAHFIQNDHRDTSDQMLNYKKGNHWYADTLFEFKPVNGLTGKGCSTAGNSAATKAVILPNKIASLVLIFCKSYLRLYTLKNTALTFVY